MCCKKIQISPEIRVHAKVCPPVGVFMGGEDGKGKGEGRLEER